jgi:hypothetical protein
MVLLELLERKALTVLLATMEKLVPRVIPVL